METLNEQQLEAKVEELQSRITETAALRAQLPEQPDKLTAVFCQEV